MGMFATVGHPVMGEFEMLAAPFSMSGSEVAVRGVGPEVPGEHSREVLAAMGLSSERIDALVASGVVGQGARP
jgi:crotonobetainyl-CoA:carnitine CoA-transferase CaiB-like acyl-CoA transferase